MRIFLVLLLGLFVTACASSPVYKGVVAGTTSEDVAILDGDCDDRCNEIIASVFNRKFPERRLLVSQVILLSINGEFGPYKYIDKRGSYNNWWDAKLAVITLKPGNYNFQSMPNHNLATRSVQSDFSFDVKKGHSYFFGGVIIRSGKDNRQDKSFEWAPVIFDKNEQRIVYPLSDIETKYQRVRTIYMMM